jgi:hypothetical protein
MAMFKKKDYIPELPTSSTLPPLPSNFSIPKSEIHGLPQMPDNLNSQKDNFNQDLLKSAVTDSQDNDEEKSSFQNYNPSLNINQDNSIKDNRFSMENFSSIRQESQNKTIYIKIDKFNALQNALDEMQEQIKNLSKQIEVLKDTKMRQIQEIDNWDNEMKKINQRLSKIDSDIFGEV